MVSTTITELALKVNYSQHRQYILLNIMHNRLLCCCHELHHIYLIFIPNRLAGCKTPIYLLIPNIQAIKRTEELCFCHRHLIYTYRHQR